MFPVQFLFPAALMILTKVPPSAKSTIKNIQADAIVVFYILFYIIFSVQIMFYCHHQEAVVFLIIIIIKQK